MDNKIFASMKININILREYSIVILLVCSSLCNYGQRGIGVLVADKSSILEVQSSTKGVLFPRMTKEERNSIVNPPEGLLVYCTNCTKLGIYYFTGLTWININEKPIRDYEGREYKTVVSPTTGKIWLDRNLGADIVATNGTELQAYGDLFQYGRGPDGHQKINSQVITTLSEVISPTHGKFIASNPSRNAWLTTNIRMQNLWDEENDVNNPCPEGFRIPTAQEFENEVTGFSSSNGAVTSFLKLSYGGKRDPNTQGGGIVERNTKGYYAITDSRLPKAYTGGVVFWATASSNVTAVIINSDIGLSVRCIKD